MRLSPALRIAVTNSRAREPSLATERAEVPEVFPAEFQEVFPGECRAERRGAQAGEFPEPRADLADGEW